MNKPQIQELHVGDKIVSDSGPHGWGRITKVKSHTIKADWHLQQGDEIVVIPVELGKYWLYKVPE